MIGRRGKEQILAALALATAIPVVRAPAGALIRRGLVPEPIWSRLPIRGKFLVTLPDGTHFAYASTPTDFVGRGLYWCGLDGYEPETTRVFRHLARQSRVVLDVGANTGLFTLLACAVNPEARVIAFEPVPRIFDRLTAQVALNGWQDRCQAHRAAVSDHGGTIDLHVPAGGLPHSASLNPNGFLGTPGNLISVPVRTIDETCAGLDGIDLVKIDVEGFEDKVLAGMQAVLARSAPAVVFEVIGGGPAARIEAALAPHGYRYYHLRRDGPVRVATITPDSAGRNRNFLALAREDSERQLCAS